MKLDPDYEFLVDDVLGPAPEVRPGTPVRQPRGLDEAGAGAAAELDEWGTVSPPKPVERSVVGGPMAGYVGAPYTLAQLIDPEWPEHPIDPTTRAYPVPGLVGAVVKAPTEAGLPGAIEALLATQLFPFAWRVRRRQRARWPGPERRWVWLPGLEGALRKYGILDIAVDAPPNGSGEPMWLELQGHATHMNGQALTLEALRENYHADRPFPGPIELRIEVATYSNTRHPNPKHWFYL